MKYVVLAKRYKSYYALPYQKNKKSSLTEFQIAYRGDDKDLALEAFKAVVALENVIEARLCSYPLNMFDKDLTIEEWLEVTDEKYVMPEIGIREI